MHKARIGILDGFRAIAIISVILFHFFSLEGMTYPYGKKYDFFFQGRYGVEFFFIISGFVIFYTLENTSSIKLFFKKRLIRLYPSAIIASTLTFIFLVLISDEKSSSILIKYLTSLTLIGPKILNSLFSNSGKTFSYLDYSLWSLWPEIQFYILAGIIYYFNRKNFIKNFTILSLFLIFIFWIISNVLGKNYFHFNKSNPLFIHINNLIQIFNLPSFIQYFTLGIQFYALFKFKHEKAKPPLSLILLTCFFVLIQLYFAINTTTRLSNILMIVAFIGFIYYPSLIRFIDNRLFNRIGVSSYFLYLIHQAIGLVLIEKLGPYFFPHSLVFPLLLIFLFISISMLYTYKLEKPILRRLNRK